MRATETIESRQAFGEMIRFAPETEWTLSTRATATTKSRPVAGDDVVTTGLGNDNINTGIGSRHDRRRSGCRFDQRRDRMTTVIVAGLGSDTVFRWTGYVTSSGAVCSSTARRRSSVHSSSRPSSRPYGTLTASIRRASDPAARRWHRESVRGEINDGNDFLIRRAW